MPDSLNYTLLKTQHGPEVSSHYTAKSGHHHFLRIQGLFTLFCLTPEATTHPSAHTASTPAVTERCQREAVNWRSGAGLWGYQGSGVPDENTALS